MSKNELYYNKLIIVDDNPICLKTIIGNLPKTYDENIFKAIIFKNPQKLIDDFESIIAKFTNHFTEKCRLLLITDQNMPEMSGTELVKQIDIILKQINKGMLIDIDKILHSSDSPDRIPINPHEIDGFMPKPLEPDIIQALISLGLHNVIDQNKIVRLKN